MEREAITQSDIRKRTYLIKQTVNNIIHDFEDRGYVTLTDNEDNRREKLVTLTEEGEEFAHSVIDELLLVEKRVVAKVGRENMKHLAELTTAFGDAFEEEIR